MYIMKKIHHHTSPRIEIGAPFVEIAQEVLQTTNVDNLSSNWNLTDAVRWLMAEGYKSRGHMLPAEAKSMLKPYSEDVDGVHSA